jgi:pantothenate kinase
MRHAFHADARFACRLSSLCWRRVHERARTLRASATNYLSRCIAAALCVIASVGSAHAGTLTAFNGLAPAAMQTFNVRIAQAQAVQTITFGALANVVSLLSRSSRRHRRGFQSASAH